MSILFIGKQNDPFCERAKEFVAVNFPNSITLLGQRGDPFPEEYTQWQGDYIISYLSPWIISEDVLERAKLASFNFHPGPPEHPGIGSTNFAIYNEETTFGVTCHHMVGKVDSGNIIDVRRFPIFPTDTVFSLTQRCYSYMLTMFYEIVSGILQRRHLPSSKETWQRKPYTRAELNELCRIGLDMPIDEIKRHIPATTFPAMPGPYIEIDGARFTLQ